MDNGVLPIQTILELFDVGCISGIEKKFVNPASIDLPLSGEAYRLQRIRHPLRGETVRDMLSKLGAEPHDLKHRLEKDVPYLIRVAGAFELPSKVYGYANPKSSTGRINLFCRVVADRVPMYDAAKEPGWSGELWVLVRADSFPVIVSPGLALSQLRLFDGKAFLDLLGIEIAARKHGLFFDKEKRKVPLHDREQGEALMLSIRVGEHMGYVCRGSTNTLDLSNVGHYDPADFGFEPVQHRAGEATLRKGEFYILETKEHVMVPPHLSAELRDIDTRFGEFRSHAAGYIDPGWGWGTNAEVRGQPITLEVIPFENSVVCDGKYVARVRYERMREIPRVTYGAAKSNYTNQQGAQLAKFFNI
jgi:dCTP deaminase